MLNGGGGLNPDGLSLDLQFAADKTLTARRGPTPSFSRASSGTFVNANGLIVGKTEGTTSSITPSTQAIGSQVTVTVASDSVVGWVVGQAISLIVDTDGQDDPDATELWLLGNIVSTTGTTLVFEVTSRTAQAGSATSWTLGYRGPRFDHTAAGMCRGLLIEESRTNTCRQSENFGSFWSAGGCAVSVNTDVAPDGNTTADSVNITNGGGHFVQQNISVSASTVYTFSFWVKRGTATALSYSIVNNNTTSNIVAPTSYYNQTSSAWARVSFTFTTPVGCTSIAIYTLRDGGSTGTVLLWGAQLEAGSFATSYIQTMAGSAVRSADVCSITGADFTSFWNNNEGTVYASGDPRASGGAVSTYLMANSGANTNQISIYRNAGSNFYGVASSGSYTANISASSASGSFNKIAGAYITNNARAAFNNVLGTPDTSVIVPTNLNRFNIGSSSTASTEFANGCIAEIKYFRKPLSNAKLQALTV